MSALTCLFSSSPFLILYHLCQILSFVSSICPSVSICVSASLTTALLLCLFLSVLAFCFFCLSPKSALFLSLTFCFFLATCLFLNVFDLLIPPFLFSLLCSERSWIYACPCALASSPPPTRFLSPSSWYLWCLSLTFPVFFNSMDALLRRTPSAQIADLSWGGKGVLMQYLDYSKC